METTLDQDALSTLVTQIEKVGSGDHKTFGGTFTGGWMLQQNPEEFAQLLITLFQYSKNPTSYLGVGTAAGGAERYIAEFLGIKDMVIMDLGTHEQFPTWQTVNKPALLAHGVDITEYIGDSHADEAETFLADLDIKYDIIGIDGDHTPLGARLDWLLVQDYLKKGTLVWFHDINYHRMRACDNGPWEIWSKLKEKFTPRLECLKDFGIGVIEI